MLHCLVAPHLLFISTKSFGRIPNDRTNVVDIAVVRSRRIKDGRGIQIHDATSRQFLPIGAVVVFGCSNTTKCFLSTRTPDCEVKKTSLLGIFAISLAIGDPLGPSSHIPRDPMDTTMHNIPVRERQ
jgi:hypothetical protein